MTDQDQEPETPPPGNGPGNGSGNGESVQPPIVVNAQYVKDLSFEAPAAPQVFGQLQRQQPNISVKVDVQARGLDPANHVYEVVLQIESECKAGDMTAFVIELSYGGVFSVNVPEENLRPVLLIECPRLLFPFARHVVATATLNGGFMPLMLGPIDFANLYQQQHAEQAGDVAVV
ncbi:MAG: protein-export chaperone SecB [Rhodospirillales bacterium]